MVTKQKRFQWIRRVAWFAAVLVMFYNVAFATGESLGDNEAVAVAQSGTPVPLNTENMDAAELAAILEAHPDTVYDYTLPVCGQQVSSGQTTLVLEGDVTLEMVQELKTWLPCLPALRQVDMFDAKLTDEDMEYFFTSFPDIHFGWTLRLGRWTVRTDAEAFSTLNHLDSPRFKTPHFEKLRYCYQLQALDLGHNKITDISFLENLTQISVLILADNEIVDISPLRNLRKLRYVELFINDIVDLSPLSDNPLLLDLNLTYNDVSDWTPLKTCPNIERLWFGKNEISKEDRSELESFFPNTKIIFSSGSTGYGWREHPRYDVIYKIFHTKKFSPFADEADE